MSSPPPDERRSYRAAMAAAQALEVMQELMRDKLDLRLVRLFSDMLLSQSGNDGLTNEKGRPREGAPVRFVPWREP